MAARNPSIRGWIDKQSCKLDYILQHFVISPEREVMFHLFSHSPLLPALHSAVRRLHLAGGATASGDTAPDFDLSDFDESPPTVPGGYWHSNDQSRADPTKGS
jgi:hypothetical protein